MGKKYNMWAKKNQTTRDTESSSIQEEPSTSGKEGKDDPRVRAFVRAFAPSVSQENNGEEGLTILELRKFFNVYPSAQTGFDPLVKILNQLEQHGFSMEVSDYRNELVLPCRRIIKNLTPISNE